MQIVAALTGHVSPETAHVTDDYPYGYTLRCKRRTWLETTNKGTRFCFQTTNPKKAGEVWNAVKKSTYKAFTAAMFLDGEGHVSWTGIGEYDDHKAVLDFVQHFGGGVNPKKLQLWVAAKVRAYAKLVDGSMTIVLSINGKEQAESDEKKAADRARYADDLAGWRVVQDALEAAHGPLFPAKEVAA